MIIEDIPVNELPMTYYCGHFLSNNIDYTVLSNLDNPSEVLYLVREDGVAFPAFGNFDMLNRHVNLVASTSTETIWYSGSLHL